MRAIIVEGADGIGKTTITKIIGKILNWKVVHQPSPDNLLGFIRKEVKHSFNWTPEERQLLHTCSHLVDYLTINEPCVFDRSYYSVRVYGEILGIDKEKLDVIVKINEIVFKERFKYFNVVVLIGTKPFKDEKEDFYEKKILWKQVNDTYLRTLKDIALIVDVTNKSLIEVVYEILDKLNLLSTITIESFMLGFLKNEEVITETLWLAKIPPGTLVSELDKETILSLICEVIND